MIDFKHNAPRPASPDITPLLDVVFILLIFFVVSAVFTAKGVDIELPYAETARAVTGRSMEIELRENGDILCDTAQITLNDLTHLLQNTFERPVSLQPDHILLKSAPRARVERFVRIIDMVRKTGFNNLIIATNTRQSETGGTDQ
ncbi:Biopolymer transport protein ExbD/TolR [Pseudodesulfovibrio mercurii]|uniref:Biopolymer transport protein ExbD/TolR n=1 Tax=Pseudodesulfovibrio mercurii TaxID=641491 RepID=F0JEJ5_9BACT|nr:biopolymer transporter ExbD [Pseudodesulfovibrio mercurii]EGB14724.1 Biopolymer transport protein ExbD/TolR [Pseudodesulfovibrio mercurii]